MTCFFSPAQFLRGVVFRRFDANVVTVVAVVVVVVNDASFSPFYWLEITRSHQKKSFPVNVDFGAKKFRNNLDQRFQKNFEIKFSFSIFTLATQGAKDAHPEANKKILTFCSSSGTKCFVSNVKNRPSGPLTKLLKMEPWNIWLCCGESKSIIFYSKQIFRSDFGKEQPCDVKVCR